MDRCPDLPRSARPLLVAAVALSTAGLAGCHYYQVTRSDGSTERISRSEYEDMQRTANRLGNVPTTRSNPTGGRAIGESTGR